MKCKYKKFLVFIMIIFNVFFINIYKVNAASISQNNDGVVKMKKILILNSYDEGFPWTKDVCRGIESILKKEMIWKFYMNLWILNILINNILIKF